MSYHYGFFQCLENKCFASKQNTYFIPSTTTSSKSSIKGGGTYIYQNNLRECIALFGTRTLPKTNWINAHTVYLAPSNIYDKSK